MYKQGWRAPNNDFQELYREVRRYALSLYPDVTIPQTCFISSRMGGRTLGRYSFSWRTRFNQYGGKEIVIYDDAVIFSNLILQTSKSTQINTIVHEIAHCVANKHMKYDCGHDCNWETIGNKIGQGFNETVHNHVYEDDALQLMAERRMTTHPYRYQLVCEKCGTICGKYKSKPRTLWVHSKDYGNLILQKI